MEVLNERVSALDIHSETVVTCVLTGRGRAPKKELRTFPTHTRGIEELRQWLREKQVSVIGMEGTGIYWRPIYAKLEGEPSWELIVGNAQHMKNVPGRKTDAKDAEWTAVLIRHGLIRPSFVPPPEIRELRDLTRYRARLVQERTREQNRILKVLQTANIKLDNVASDVFGVSGMDMLQALAEGTQPPRQMAQLARGLLRKKIDALELALEGTLSVVHREMLKIALQRLDQANEHIRHVEELIEQRVRPFEDAIELLIDIPGIERTAAIAIIAEIGLDMSVFPTKEHLASWAGVCPGNNESAGKRRSGKASRGNLHLKTALCQCAQSTARTKRSYFRDKFYRLKARRSHNRAIMAIARKILEAIHIILSHKLRFKDLGPTYLDERDHTRIVTRLAQRIEALGYSVTVAPNGCQQASAQAEPVSEQG